jgi:4'-phosphopantetheinyl transferase
MAGWKSRCASRQDWLQMASETIDLRVGLLDAIDTPQVHEACLAALSSAERLRAARFVFDRHRRQYVLAHGLLRYSLSAFAPNVEPADWSFTTARYGRPFVAAPAIAGNVYFSLSHTGGCMACAVSPCEAIGVDVEQVRYFPSLFATACRTFSSEEVDVLRGLPSGELIDRFFDYWTLKEAYLKARGTGLSFPLGQFSILISADQRIEIRFMSGAADDSRGWHFMKSSPSISHRLAVADGSGAAGGLPIVVRPWPVPCIFSVA